MTPPSLLAVAVLGMGVVFVFLVFLSAMMAALTAIFGRRAPATPTAGTPTADTATAGAGPGSPGWIAAATAAFLAAERDAAVPVSAASLPSAAAWRPYDTVESARWRLRMP